MPGGDLATKFPERMLFGILPDDQTTELLASRGWSGTELRMLQQQVAKQFNTTPTTSTGRILDAAAALLGICRQKTYDGEPAMRLESAGWGRKPTAWEIRTREQNGSLILDTPHLLRTARSAYLQAEGDSSEIGAIAASFQYNLARGIADMAISIANENGFSRVALSGGVSYNEAIRTTIAREVQVHDLDLVINQAYPLGDGCISYGQCVWAGMIPDTR
jgi:hydrogenase maturation protein HypF